MFRLNGFKKNFTQISRLCGNLHIYPQSLKINDQINLNFSLKQFVSEFAGSQIISKYLP